MLVFSSYGKRTRHARGSGFNWLIGNWWVANLPLIFISFHLIIKSTGILRESEASGVSFLELYTCAKFPQWNLFTFRATSFPVQLDSNIEMGKWEIDHSDFLFITQRMYFHMHIFLQINCLWSRLCFFIYLTFSEVVLLSSHRRSGMPHLTFFLYPFSPRSPGFSLKYISYVYNIYILIKYSIYAIPIFILIHILEHTCSIYIYI